MTAWPARTAGPNEHAGTSALRRLCGGSALRARITLVFALPAACCCRLSLAGRHVVPHPPEPALPNARTTPSTSCAEQRSNELDRQLTPTIRSLASRRVVQSLEAPPNDFIVSCARSTTRPTRMATSELPGRVPVDDVPRSLQAELVTAAEPARMRTTARRTARPHHRRPAQAGRTHAARSTTKPCRSTTSKRRCGRSPTSCSPPRPVTAGLGAFLGTWAARRTLRPLGEASAAAEAIAGGRPRHPARPTGRPRPRIARRLFQRDGRRVAGAGRARRAVRLRGQPRAALAADDADRLGRGARNPSRRAARARPDRRRSAVHAISQRFKQLVEDLLEITRFDVGTARLELDELNLVEFAARQRSRASDRPRAHRATTRPWSRPIIHADKRRLARVLQNLIENAAKYGDGATRVELSDLGDSMQIAVEDSGTRRARSKNEW